MKLRAKTLAAVGGATLALGLTAAVVTAIALLYSARNAEYDLASRDLQRAQDAFLQEVEGLRDSGRYWWIWDESFAFAESRDPKFVEANLYDTVLDAARLDFVVFLDRSCRLIHAALASGQVDAATADPVPALTEWCSSRDPLSSAGPDGVAGVLRVGGRAAIVAAGPILSSKREGPARGTLLVGRRLDDRTAARLRRTTQLDIGLLDDVGEHAAVTAARSTAAAERRDVVEPRSAAVIESFRWLADLDGKPTVVLRVRGARESHARTIVFVQVLFLCSLGVCLVACSTVLLFLDRIVMGRLSHVIDSVKSIGQDRDFAARLFVEGRDELGLLAAEINCMLDALESSQNQLQIRDAALNRTLLALEAAKGDLEARVHERTLALTAANADLRRARDTAETASRAKSEFLANMSHEIRTPLNAILGMAEVALDGALDDDQRECIEIVRASGSALLGIVNDVLDLSKIEARKLQLDHVEFDVHDELASTMTPFGPRAAQKGIELVGEIRDSVPRRVVGDPGRVRQALANLVGNAVKFTDVGEVHVVCSARRLRAGDALLRIAVRDTGPGVPRDKQALVFEAFEQADTSVTRSFGGTGLGLSIASSLARLMGGRIRLDSRPGRGSVFVLTVRLGVAGGPAPVRDRPWTGRRVLIAAPNATCRNALARCFAAWGAEAITAARAPAPSRELDLAVLDARLLPEMDADSLRATARNVLVLLERGGRVPALPRAGIVSTLYKPVLPDVLRREAGRAIGLEAPSPDRSSEPPRPERFAAAPRRGASVLVAEDNPVNQRVAARLLERAGHRVTIVADGREAVNAALAERFDLILMDVQMPVLDGVAATREIRAHEAGTGNRVPIVALTAHALTTDRERCLAAGMDGYVSKPIDSAGLYAVIDELVLARS